VDSGIRCFCYMIMNAHTPIIGYVDQDVLNPTFLKCFNQVVDIVLEEQGARDQAAYWGLCWEEGVYPNFCNDL